MILDILKLNKANEAILRATSTNVTEFNRELADLISNMAETMFAANGVGLAAPQIGVNKNLFVMRTEVGMRRDKREFQAIINPVLQKMDEHTYSDEEGCLSLPGLRGQVLRSKSLSYLHEDGEGNQRRGSARNLEGRIFQHEFDHLCGVLFVDRASGLYVPGDVIPLVNPDPLI
jgi:peptide deformylase